MGIVLALRVRLRPWSIAAMPQHRTAPRYLYEDAGRPVLGLKELFGTVVCTIVGHLAVPYPKSLGVVRVDKENDLADGYYEASLALMRQRRNILSLPRPGR